MLDSLHDDINVAEHRYRAMLRACEEKGDGPLDTKNES